MKKQKLTKKQKLAKKQMQADKDSVTKGALAPDPGADQDLLWACASDDIESVRFMLKFGLGNVNATDKVGRKGGWRRGELEPHI